MSEISSSGALAHRSVIRRIPSVALLFFVLASCACTQIGCESVLRIEFTDVEFQPEATYHLDICIDDDCVSEPVTIDVPHPGTGEIDLGRAGDGQILVWANSNDIDFRLREDEYPESVEVSVTVTNAGGSVLAHSVSDVQVSRFQPNGPLCGSTCFNAQVTV